MPNKRNSVLLYSGGLDAYCLDKIRDFDTRVFVDVGTAEAQEERELIRETEVDVEELDMGFLAHHEKAGSPVIPFRNAFLLMGGAFYGNEIAFGGTAGDGIDTVDTDQAFASTVGAVLNQYHEREQSPDRVGGGPYEVTVPAGKMTKAELVYRAVDRKPDLTVEDVAEETRSCHDGSNDKGCGECVGCVRRFTALTRAAMACGAEYTDYDRFFEGDIVDFIHRDEVVPRMEDRGAEFEEFEYVKERIEPVEA